MEEIKFEFIDEEAFWPIKKKLSPIVFAENNFIQLDQFCSEEEKKLSKELRSKSPKKFGVYILAKNADDEVVGWSGGHQIDSEMFCMITSAVLPEYRRKNIYSSMLKLVVDKVTQEGFQIITSNHLVTNNAVIIPKLIFGFHITAMKMNLRFGTLVELSFYPNKKIEDVLKYRCGEIKSV
jgi:hypothetical protein